MRKSVKAHFWKVVAASDAAIHREAYCYVTEKDNKEVFTCPTL